MVCVCNWLPRCMHTPLRTTVRLLTTLSSLKVAEPAQRLRLLAIPGLNVLTFQVYQKQVLRYGENSHSVLRFMSIPIVPAGLLSNFFQLQGKELSYNNIADSDSAWDCVRSFAAPACVIVKHANPCGVATAGSAVDAYLKAFKTDPTSAFGGIIAFNRTVDLAAAQAVSGQFVEVLLAPAYDPDALALLASKKNVRVLQVPMGDGQNDIDVKRIGGGWLVQTPDCETVQAEDLRVVTRKQPTAEQMRDLLFAWKVAKFVKSNAIVFCVR